MARNKYKNKIFSGEIHASGLFETDVDLIETRIMLNTKFLERYEYALNLYVEGFWPEAKEVLN